MGIIKILENVSSTVEEASDTSQNVVTETSNPSTFETMISSAVNWLTENGLKLVIGIIALLIFCWIVNLFKKILLKRILKKGKTDKFVANALCKGIGIGLKLLGVVVFFGYVGIDTAGVGAVISSIGVVIGLAVQGSLSNFAGGLVILVMRPFRLGDFIEAQGYSGTVEEIHIFYTYLTTPDNKVVMVPNGALANGNIVNYSRKNTRRVDLAYSISYSSDLEKAKEIIREIVNKHPLVLKEPLPTIELDTLGDSSLKIVCRPWVKKDNYWKVYFDLNKMIKKAFDENGVEIPFNQIDVHIVDKK